MFNSLLKALWVILFPLCLFAVASCSNNNNEEDNSPKEENKEEESKDIKNVHDEEAGFFTVANISYDDYFDRLTVNALDGDTLCIVFTPEKKYRDAGIAFTVTCESLGKLNDSLYVVKNIKTGENRILLTATYHQETSDSIVDYSAKEELTVIIPEAYVTIPYKVGVSNDLLSFVDTKVTYTDAEGASHTYVIPSESWVRSDSVTYHLWVDSDNRSHLVEAGKDNVEAGWTLEDEIKELPYPYYTFILRYYKVGITSSVSVSYVPKNGATPERESYDFYHKLFRGKADVHVPNVLYIDNSISVDLTINIGDDGRIKKDDVKGFIEELSSKPDFIKLSIDPGHGGIKEI